MDQSRSVKETIEFINGVTEVAVTAKKVMKDGRIDFSDIKHLSELASKHEMLIEAVKGANEIPAEIKDLTVEELQEIGRAVLQAYDRFKAV